MPVTITNYITVPGAGGKFVVLELKADSDNGMLLFADFTHEFQHHDIVRRWEDAHKLSISAAGYVVAGGGWWKLEDNTLILYGQSAAYGRFNPEWVRERLTPGTVLTETKVDVR